MGKGDEGDGLRRQETTMTLKWIGKGLRMGTVGSLAKLLRDAKGKRKYAVMWD
jgi:hypothetical protein